MALHIQVQLLESGIGFIHFYSSCRYKLKFEALTYLDFHCSYFKIWNPKYSLPV